jgi:thioredoxin-related protein
MVQALEHSMIGPLRVLTISLLFAAGALSVEPTWFNNFHDARVAAKKAKRPILATFTGSDWSDWSAKLKEQILDSKEFRAWAADKVVLFTADFPKQSALASTTKAQNAELAQRYGIEAFPTVLILDADGKKLGEIAYDPAGPKAWINKCDEIVKRK